MRPVKGRNTGKTVTRLSQDLIHMAEQIIYKEILRYVYTQRVNRQMSNRIVLCTFVTQIPL